MSAVLKLKADFGERVGQSADLEPLPGPPLLARWDFPRGYPRVGLEGPVQISVSGGRAAAARLVDVSPDCIEAICDRATLHRVMPPGGLPRGGGGLEILVRMTLPLYGDTEEFHARCEVGYIRPMGRAGFTLGIVFKAMSAANAHGLQAFIEESLIPEQGSASG